MVDDGRFLEGDARDLIAKGQLTEGEWHMMQQDAKSVKANLHNRMLAQLDRELSTAIASQPTDQVLDTDVAAAIAGGLWGAASAFFKTPVATRDAPASKSSFLWETAKEAALKSMETNQKIRAVDYLKLEHHSGDISTCEHVVIAVNGFMTHGMDPSTNWAPYCQRKNVACYVVLWEAGNGAEWDDFVDKFQGHLETGREDVIATHFTGNPWNRAKNKAHQVGHILADVLRTHPTLTRGRKVTLLGHSLGGAVLYSLLDRLAAQNALSPHTRFDLHRVVFFAGAFVPAHNFGAVAANAFPDIRQDRILNVYSTQDCVLNHLFRVATILQSHRPAAGCTPIQSHYVVDVDVSALLAPETHTAFGHSYELIMEHVCDRLDGIWDLPNASSSSKY